MVPILLTYALLHLIDGREIRINPGQVTQLVEPRHGNNRQLTEAVKCVVRLTDGSYISISETCFEAQRILLKAMGDGKG